MGISNFINHSFLLNGRESSNFIESSFLPRHRWYYYKEGFSPNLVNAAIDSYDLGCGSKLLDPFNGSGTVTLSAAEKGIESLGIEVNPFTSFVARTKTYNTKNKVLSELFEKTYEKVQEQQEFMSLEKFSTFTELSGEDKWLFNVDVLRSFYGGFSFLKTEGSNAAELLKLALITSIMEVSNARKDGKCMKYKEGWKEKNYTKKDFINSFVANYVKIEEDTKDTNIKISPQIIQSDSRSFLSLLEKTYDLIITSPPYLNTFDYTDIYRPELFVGEFVQSSAELYTLRHKTVRSHIQVKWEMPDLQNISSAILRDIFNKLKSRKDLLMHNKIPYMVLAYFEDMGLIFKQLSLKTNKNGHLWMVVSNSAYANEEIPVDLILADLATKNGWRLKEIGVLREIRKRKTRHSPDIDLLRESVLILEKK